MTLDSLTDSLTLTGTSHRLEPLDRRHAAALAAASAEDPAAYQWTPVPQGVEAAARYIDTALKGREAGTSVPFVLVRQSDGRILGSTRFWELEHWAWPADHPRHGRTKPDVCEIGYTWLAQSAIRTAANTEAKLLMLTHAFESWQVLRVCLHTDARTLRSRAAIERIGGRFEGILRAHRMAVDFIPRDSARYSILQSEWSEVKQRLNERLNRGRE